MFGWCSCWTTDTFIFRKHSHETTEDVQPGFRQHVSLQNGALHQAFIAGLLAEENSLLSWECPWKRIVGADS